MLLPSGNALREWLRSKAMSRFYEQQASAAELALGSRRGPGRRNWTDAVSPSSSATRGPSPFAPAELAASRILALQALFFERAFHASIEKILSERAYTADAVQKLFEANGTSPNRSGFRAVVSLADYADVREEYEGAVEQFLRDEREYVVVESFDHARLPLAYFATTWAGAPPFLSIRSKR